MQLNSASFDTKNAASQSRKTKNGWHVIETEAQAKLII